MAKRTTARASSGHFSLTYAPQRLEEAIEALTHESIEQSLGEIEIAFQRHFAVEKPTKRKVRRQLEAQ